MRRRLVIAVPLALWLCAVVGAAQAPAAQDPRDKGWKIPPEAEGLKNPLPPGDVVLLVGKKVFASKCERCHGKTGTGNGPDSDAKYQKDMDLTVVARADKNPDGVIFYRVWNGRMNPKMPAQSGELTKEQVWAVVAYVQTLRKR